MTLGGGRGHGKPPRAWVQTPKRRRRRTEAPGKSSESPWLLPRAGGQRRAPATSDLGRRVSVPGVLSADEIIGRADRILPVAGSDAVRAPAAVSINSL